MKKNGLFIFIVLLVLPLFVNAETFKDGDTTYVLEERKISCLSEDASLYHPAEENWIFLDTKDGKEVYVVVNADNECTIVEDFSDYLVIDKKIEYYNLESKDDNYVIKKITENYDWFDYKKTEDTELKEGKNYYNKTEYGAMLIPESELKVEDIETYYEDLFLEVAKNKEFNEEETYYQLVGGYNLEVVEDPKEEDLNKYFVEMNNPTEEVIVKTLEGNKIQPIIDSLVYAPYVEKIGDNYYIVAQLNDETTNKLIYELYDINGKKIEISDKILRINYISDDLLVLYGVNNTSVYNTRLEKLYDIKIENIDTFDYLFSKNHTSYLLAWDNVNYKEKFYNLYEYIVLDEVEEATSDKDISIRFSGLLDRLEKVYLNDKELDKENYILKSGSTIVTLKSEFLKTLKEGDYVLKVEYNDGTTLSSTFKLKEVKNEVIVEDEKEEIKNEESTDKEVVDTQESPKVPKTLDNIYTHLLLSIISVITILFTIKSIKRKTLEK